jgi:hypothetical protein
VLTGEGRTKVRVYLLAVDHPKTVARLAPLHVARPVIRDVSVGCDVLAGGGEAAGTFASRAPKGDRLTRSAGLLVVVFGVASSLALMMTRAWGARHTLRHERVIGVITAVVCGRCI